jgi:ABC-type cobalamin/Fe3+-siderophores transport system ATPase subunit
LKVHAFALTSGFEEFGDALVPLDITIPKSDGTTINLTVNMGERLFVLGANGAGKSFLMHRFYNTHRNNGRRISAHRQTWFASNAISLSPEQKRHAEINIRDTDARPEARWQDAHPAQRASIAIYDLIDAENVRARSIASAVDADNIDLAKTLAKKDAPIKIINELLRLANMPIEISVHENEQVLASKSGSDLYTQN